MKFKILRYCIWYLYFSAYWTVFNWGEKTKPRNNASNFMSLTILINLSAIYQILVYFGYPVSILFVIFFCALPAFIIPYLLFQSDKVFNLKFKEFEFLRGNECKQKRIIVIFSIASFSIIFNTAVAIFRNLMKR